MLPLVALVEGALWAGGALGVSAAWDAFTGSKTSVPPPAPYHQPTPTNVPATIPTSSSKKNGGLVSLADEAIGFGTGLMMGGNTVNNTAVTNYNNSIQNTINNYNNNTTNNNNALANPMGTSLLEVLAAQNAGSIAIKQSIDDLVAATGAQYATLGYLSSVVGNGFTSLITALGGLTYVIASLKPDASVTTCSSSSPNISVSNNIDVSAIVSAVEALSVDLKSLMPQSRLDFYDKTNQISDYKLTPAPIVDVHGNDGLSISPLELQSKKDLAVATSHALENSTTLDDFDSSDLFDDDLLLQEAMKLFKFNGIADNLQEMANSISADGNINGYTPNVDLKG